MKERTIWRLADVWEFADIVMMVLSACLSILCDNVSCVSISGTGIVI